MKWVMIPFGWLLAVPLLAMGAPAHGRQRAPGLASVEEMLRMPGIQPLDSESLKQAMSNGETKGAEPNDPFALRARDYERARQDSRLLTPELAARLATLMAPQRFTFFIETPYSVAAALAATAKRKFEPRPALSFATLNEAQVSIVVGHGPKATETDIIEKVVIKRGSAVIQPLRSNLLPIQIQNGFGAVQINAQGTFMFPFAVFEPSAPVTIVMIGRAQNFEWTLVPSELAQMK